MYGEVAASAAVTSAAGTTGALRLSQRYAAPAAGAPAARVSGTAASRTRRTPRVTRDAMAVVSCPVR
ncbi:hypothetical protein GCM10010129_78500 [Streptomyces fumigatiscleroticus]|nr:hypothetical protein GCM10010129_78500 [Streptomyces fumigatiscleroticus]